MILRIESAELKILQTMPNHKTGIKLMETHKLPLPQCCPVSKNPRPGSVIYISYIPNDCFLEVYSLREYIDDFIGGHPNGIRDMEQMIQTIALDCHNAVGVSVSIRAELIIEPNQEMILELEYPQNIKMEKNN